MNFKVFGGLLATVGAVLSLIGFPQVFPNFGKSQETIRLELMAEATSVSPETIENLKCFFNDTKCEEASAATESTFQIGPMLLWGGFALLILGLIIFISARSNSK